MSRLLSLVALALLATSLRADPPSVADLVKQLGDPKFAVREAAQKELLKRGEAIAPELDRLGKGVDAETADRIAKVRYNLVGYKEDIRRCILDIKRKRGLFDPIPGELNLPSDLRYLIADHQPGAGDLLLAMAADEKGQFWYETRHLFVQAWDVMTADQLDRHIRQTVRLGTTHRPKFPAKVPAMISFEAGLRDAGTDWPHPVPKAFTFRARTTRYLDGKPYDKPYERNDPVATVGWYRVGELAEGKHTIHAVMEYEFTQNGQKRKGEVRSKDSTFEVVSADTPDDLLAPKSDARAAQVRAALSIREPVSERPAPQFGGRVVLNDEPVDPPPQVSWDIPGGRAGLVCLTWELKEPLDVDLCFDVTLKDNKTGTVYPADPIVVVRGARGRGYIYPRNPQRFARERDGLRGVTVDLKPSRGLALTDPRISRYFPETITRGELLMKVVPKIEPPANHK
jgi:hypothetical protein